MGMPPSLGTTLRRFVGASIRLSLKGVPAYIPSNSVGGSPFFHALSSIYFSVGLLRITTLICMRESSLLFCIALKSRLLRHEVIYFFSFKLCDDNIPVESDS